MSYFKYYLNYEKIFNFPWTREKSRRKMRHEVKKKNLGWHWANMKWLIWNIYSNPHKDVMGADVHRPISDLISTNCPHQVKKTKSSESWSLYCTLNENGKEKRGPKDSIERFTAFRLKKPKTKRWRKTREGFMIHGLQASQSWKWKEKSRETETWTKSGRGKGP